MSHFIPISKIIFPDDELLYLKNASFSTSVCGKNKNKKFKTK
jgi:hypothetical protein